jgi:hypothetical protein
MVLESGVKDQSGGVPSRGVVKNVPTAKSECFEKGVRYCLGEGRGQRRQRRACPGVEGEAAALMNKELGGSIAQARKVAVKMLTTK